MPIEQFLQELLNSKGENWTYLNCIKNPIYLKIGPNFSLSNYI